MLQDNKKQPVLPSGITYKNTATLSGHNDGVRDIYFHSSQNVLVSVSEDSLIKLWDINDINKQNNQSFLTIREHSGPIFTITGADDLAFTGGMEGVIRCWKLPSKKEEVTSQQGNFWMRGIWENGQQQKLEPVWQLLYNQADKTLLSTSSDSTIKLYNIIESGARDINGQLKQVYIYRFQNSQKFTDEDIPTTVCLPEHNPQHIASGFANTHALVLFDKETAKIVNTLKFTASGQVSTNKIVSYPGFMISAQEDRMIRIFDSNKMVQQFKAHQDSVVSLSILANKTEYVSCSHDGFIKLWDIRKNEPLQQLKMHSKKYDETIHCITAHPTKSLISSGGADSLIKIYAAQ